MQDNRIAFKEIFNTVLITLLVFVVMVMLLLYPSLFILLLLMDPRILSVVRYGCLLALPSLLTGLIVTKRKKKFLMYWGAVFGLLGILCTCNFAYIAYDDKITIDTSPSIQVSDYQPFAEETKIALLNHEAYLKLTDDLPVLDGAAAVLPLYSAFARAVYPENTRIYDGILEYNNTVGGYRCLADRNSDIFFGAYPSGEQIAYAKEQGTEFVYTPIGMEAFVFFVHKDNPIDNLTTEQIQMIYTGEITNWNQVGGSNESIIPFQRNEGSGSQSMLLRFMDGKQPMEPDTETKIGGMLDIIETVADYRNKEGSIGFSFRFYLEGIIKNPDIKLLHVDGVAPTVENIQNGTYPLTTSLYAVTYEGNSNPNVALLLEWILSPEGQELVEKTGYVPIT